MNYNLVEQRNEKKFKGKKKEEMRQSYKGVLPFNCFWPRRMEISSVKEMKIAKRVSVLDEYIRRVEIRSKIL